ncbi:uncharacterized protein GIQ15_03113 [Arthroderma uncinatum]|uniref:uncharacterized protein n=1 Tax=Arthroderma uncinatum TaxID=74035 RepID=UPI00144AF0F8|nr:uncharacterized protein GIQ15_03113 [Arthroderma uncinatum]KAF3483789.1 hypothetical protein GIQ15_03113 [Arthroderma uncinatum]
MNGNSVQAAEAPVTPTPAKRKREASAEEGEGDGTVSKPEDTEDTFTDILKDLSLVLSKHDSDLGILRRPLTHVSAGEPDNKRVKRSKPAAEPQTIQSRVDKANYQSLQAFLHDVEQSISSFIAESPRHESKTHQSIGPASPSSRVNNFRKELNRLVLKLPPQEPSAISSKPTKTEDASETLDTSARNDRLALALVDNTPHGRQIFSSLQLSDSSINETALPKGIVVTKVVPFNPLHLEESGSRTRTIGEVFSPRSNVPLLERPPKRPAESSPSVVKWLDPLDIASSVSSSLPGRKGYSSISLPSGSWLNYGYENPSASGHHPRLSKQENSAKEASSKEDNSLFQALYSSFAPSFDSSGAIAPRAAKYQAWWEKSGANRVNVLFSSEQDEPQTSSMDHPILNQAVDPQLLDEETLSEAVESFKPDTYVDKATESEDPESEKKKSEGDMTELLNDISDLLQTLNSYRQLRNLSQASPDKAADQSNGATANREPTTTPSDAEYGIYETLKTSLSTLVASLPPYAVSKLTGAQLAELNLSKKILLDSADYPGTMEDDDFTKQRKQAAQAQQNMANSRGPVPAAPQARPQTYQTPVATTPYQRQPSTRAKHIPTNYQSPQGYAGRPPPAAHYQPTNSPQPFPQHPQPGQRPGYMQPQYQQPAGASPPYSRSGMLQQFQRSASNGVPPYPQRRPSPAQTPTQPYPHRTPQAAYQPIHGQQQPPLNHAASPQRPPNYNQSPQRTPYLKSPSANPAQPRYFQQQTPQPLPYANYPPGQANQVSTPYSKPSPGMAYSRSAAEQAAIMDRNKLQLLDNRGQAVASPQPMQPNGQGQARDVEMHNGQPNGLPMAGPGPSK